VRVAVVGAGLAGLAAADGLTRAGVEVVVLEARDRVGGRVWSQTLSNGAIVELGAEFVLPGSHAVHSVVDRFGLGLWEKGMRYGARAPRGGIPVDAATLVRATATIAAALAPLGRPAGVSAEDFLGRLELDEGAREAVRARLEVSSAATADRVDASVLAGLAAHADDVCPSVAGGNQRLALALAGALDDPVRLGASVERIAWSDDGVDLAAAGTELRADRVVLAVPASVVERIAFDPPLPDRLASAFSSVAYGHAAKLFVPLRRDAPTSAVLSVPERYWTWTATGADGVQPVVSAFAGSAPALDALGVRSGPETWLASLAALRPDLALDARGAVLSTWDDDPWVGAAYSTTAPPEEAWRPAGPFHVCGEHTAGAYAALMEGALRSGLRVADEVRAAAA
jgi:monoamine oxidase